MSDRDFPLIGCVGHDCATCAANAQELAQLRASLATAQADRDNLLANNEKLGDLISSMDQQITTLVAERDQMKENWDGAAGTCSRLHKALAVAERENATLRAELATCTSELLEMHTSLNGEAAARIKAEDELATAQAALQARQAAIDELVACRKLWAMSGNAASSAKYHTRMPLAWQTARALATPANPSANPPKEETK